MRARLTAMLAVVSLACASLVAYAAGPYPALDAQATARVGNANATSTAAYRLADSQTATAGVPTVAPTATLAGGGGPRTIPSPIYGVTIDDISGLSSITAALSGLPHMPTSRIVFDRQNAAGYYTAAVSAITPVSYTMGTLLDSSDMAAVSAAAVTSRAQQYLTALPNLDLWEVGNEINGEWNCKGGTCSASETADVVAKMSSMFDVMHNAGKRTALTLYYNGLDDTNNCYAQSASLMSRWAAANVPARMVTGLDFVFISYYQQDCPGAVKDWQTVFTNLHAAFPSAQIGFGENGTTQASASTALKQQYMAEYYGMNGLSVPNYVGGHFWWYAREDIVPKTNPLWTYLANLMAAHTG